MGGLAVGTVVTVSAGLGPSAGRSVVGVGVILLAREQLLQEQEFGQDQSDDGHDQSLLGDQSDTEQSQDGQTDDLQLDESEDWQQRLEELLLAAGFRDHGAHRRLDVLGDDGREAAGGAGHVQVERTLLEEVLRALQHVVLQGFLAAFDVVGGLDDGTVGVERARVTVRRLDEGQTSGEADLWLVEELTGLAVELWMEKREGRRLEGVVDFC